MSGQLVAMALLPKFSGGASFLASIYIMIDVLKDPIKRSTHCYTRLMLGLSFVDAIASFGVFLSTWPVPEESGYLWASGNDATCRLQGVLIQIGVASPIYNLSLAMYYMLVLKHQWSDAKLKRIEPWLHAVPLIYGFGTALGCIPTYAPSTFWCFINTGPNGGALRLVLTFAVPWTCILLATIFTVISASHVIGHTQRAISFRKSQSIPQDTEALQRIAKRVLWQAIHYVMVLYLTWTFNTTARVMQFASQPVPYWLIVCFLIFLPAQGFFNWTVYIRPRFVHNRQARRMNFCQAMFVGIRAKFNESVRKGSISRREESTDAPQEDTTRESQQITRDVVAVVDSTPSQAFAVKTGVRPSIASLENPASLNSKAFVALLSAHKRNELLALQEGSSNKEQDDQQEEGDDKETNNNPHFDDDEKSDEFAHG